ncbi:hypothetical protein FBU30_001319 [Linnemannia zychae]|nr:hypothetical protein FBU30_001319 [Linnemannia zychae]
MTSINTKQPSPPTQQPHQQHTHSSQVEVDSSFDSLVESSKALLEALQTWIAANTKHNENVTSVPLSTPNTPSITQGTNAAALYNFDAAWTSYYNFFEAWKDKDSQRLLKALLDHAQQIETLWSTVQNDPTARAEWGLQIEKQRKDLREKARQIAGPDGVAKIDEIFADFVRVTTSASLPSSTTTLLNTATSPASETIATVSMEADSGTGTSIAQPTVIDSTHPSYSLEEPISPSTSTSATITSNTTKKRQRVLSIPNDDSPMNMDEPSIGTHLVPPVVVSATSTSNEDDLTSTMEGPQPKKPTRARGPRQPAMPAGFEKQEKWSNLQLIHELALDPNFKIESKRSGGAGPTSDEEDGGGNDANNAESLESRIRAMATKAYFDKIREDAEQGQLAKWIPPLLTTIREQLLDMVPSQSSVARQIREGFDLDFVQQQVDRKVYDVKAALESVLSLMAKLCAPVRDPAIRKIQHDLSLIHGNPLQQLPSQTNSQTVRSTSTSATPKDFVSVLKDILELLEEMLMDLANYRLMVARPSLEKQAIPYEQHAFKTSLESGDITLDATTAWLEVSAAKVLNTPTISTPTTTTESIPTTSVTTSSSSPLLPPPSLSSSVKTNRHYEVYVNAVLDLLYSKTPLELASKEEFPETFMLDQARLTRYQNELQALTLIAVMLNISLNVQPPLRGEEQDELKQTLFRLMEKVDTSKESLAEAIIEAKEKALLLTARPSSSLSARATSSATSSAASFLLSAEQKSYLRNTIERAISFDSSLYNMLSQRIRKVLESYLLSSQPGGKLGVMPNPPELIKFGLGAMTKEIENFSAQIGFLIRYNAKVYQSWYDPILTKILPGTTRTSSKSKTSGSGSGTASIPASASSSAATDPIPTVASGTETKTSSNTPDTVVDPTASTSSLAQENSTANGKSGSSPSPPSPSPSV